jgi:hypothetical protein
MSKKRREKMKAKAARHSKPEQADESRKAAASETSQANSKKAQKQGSIANVRSARNGGVAEASASSAKKSKVAMEPLNANGAPHLKGMSSSWRAFYEEIARKARA